MKITRSASLLALFPGLLVSACSPTNSGTVPEVHKRVFVTNTTYTGDLTVQASVSDGLAAADKLCQQAALAAVLGGTWKAWISGSGVDAKSRISDVGPWYLLDGQTKVFNNAAGLTTTPLAPINLTEQKTGVGANPQVWTGTENGGVSASVHCNNWTMMTGIGPNLSGRAGDGSSTSNWTSSPLVSYCTSRFRLYCFEQ